MNVQVGGIKMKGFLKFLVWMVVLAAILVGVYFVLPEYPQNYVKSIVQPIIDTNASVRMEQVKALTVKELDNATYNTLLSTRPKNACWSYRMDETTGVEYVTFYGRGLTINLKEWPDYNGILSTSAIVKFEFEINGAQVNIHPYVDGQLMEINDAKNTFAEKNKDIRIEILRQVYQGGSLEEQ